MQYYKYFKTETIRKNQKLKTEPLAKKKIPCHGQDCGYDPAIPAAIPWDPRL